MNNLIQATGLVWTPYGWSDELIESCVSTKKPMFNPVDLQEFSLAFKTEYHVPDMLHLSSLQCSGIVPLSWELARAPICTPQQAQVSFQNGIVLTAQGSHLTFSEPIGARLPSEVEIAKIASQYLKALPHAGYRSMGLSFRGFVPFPEGDLEAAHIYLNQKFLAPGAWQQFGQRPMQAGLNFVYALEGRQLYVSLNMVTLRRQPDQHPTPSLMFSGTFDYVIEDLAMVQAQLDQWQTDLDLFKELVNTRFLDQALAFNSAPESFNGQQLQELAIAAS
jgi:hypothetical protein